MINTNYIAVPIKKGMCLPMFAPSFMQVWGIFNTLTQRMERGQFYTRHDAEQHIRTEIGEQ